MLIITVYVMMFIQNPAAKEEMGYIQTYMHTCTIIIKELIKVFKQFGQLLPFDSLICILINYSSICVT